MKESAWLVGQQCRSTKQNNVKIKQNKYDIYIGRAYVVQVYGVHVS